MIFVCAGTPVYWRLRYVIDFTILILFVKMNTSGETDEFVSKEPRYYSGIFNRIVLSLTISTFVYGYHFGMLASIYVLFPNTVDFGIGSFPISVTSIVFTTVGAAIGAIASAYISQKYG
jgi:hypothetical protein